MKQPVLEFIEGGIRVFDGGMGSMLIAAGMPTGVCPENYDGDVIRSIYEKYVDAGADFILTCTFGASAMTLAKHGLAERTREINARNAKLARQAADDRAYVVGDVGPSGEMLQPFGNATEEQMLEAFTEQARGLEDGGVDCYIVETMSDPNELKTAARAVRSVSDKPLFASMTFSCTPGGFRTMMGTTIEQAIAAMDEVGVDVVGTNCTLAPDDMVALVKELCAATPRPVLAQPNAGRPQPDGDRVVYPPIENIEQHIEATLDAGARLIGGCCGTEPDYVRKVRAIADRRNAS